MKPPPRLWRTFNRILCFIYGHCIVRSGPDSPRVCVHCHKHFTE